MRRHSNERILLLSASMLLAVLCLAPISGAGGGVIPVVTPCPSGACAPNGALALCSDTGAIYRCNGGTWGLPPGGGGGTPGGLNTQVQFNDAATFGGDAGLTYNKTTDMLTAVGVVITETRYANPAHAGSVTCGIQEQIDALPSAGGTVVVSAGTTCNATVTIWLHSNVTLMLNGATLKRATGSIIDFTDPDDSGAVINVSPKGSNGTLPTSITSQSNIAIIGPGIIDGNQSNFTSLTDTSLGVFGIRAHFVDGFFVDNVKIQNVLQDGLSLVEDRNVHVSNLTLDTIGTWSVTSSRNGISLNNYALTAGWSERATFTGISMKDIGDEAFGGSMAWNYVTIDGLTVDTADIVFEIGADRNTSGWAVSNVVGTGIKSSLVTFGGVTPNIIYSDFSFYNCNIQGHTSLHELFAISFNAAASYRGIHFNGVRFTNINSANIASGRWFNLQPNSSNSMDGLWISNSYFSGPTLVVDETDDIGLYLRGAVKNVFVSNTRIANVQGIGVSVNDNTAYAGTTEKIYFDTTVVENAKHDCYQVIMNGGGAASTLQEVSFNDSAAIDCATKAGVGATTGWRIGQAQSGGTIRKISFNHARSFKTAGTTHLYGLNLFQSVGTIDDVQVRASDFTGVQTAQTNQSGTITNFTFNLADGVLTNSVALTTDTVGDYVSGVTASQGLLKTGTEGATLGLIDCLENEILKSTGVGGTSWTCQADATGAGGGDPVLIEAVAITDGSGVDFKGGTGVDFVLDAGLSPDTATANFDATEITGTTTWGAGAAQTFVWNVATTDPTFAFDTSLLTVTNMATLTATGTAAAFDTVSTTAKADGSNYLEGFGNTIDVADPPNGSFRFYGKGASTLEEPFWRNGTSVFQIPLMTMADLAIATCTLGQLGIDTGGATKEWCVCGTANVWGCWKLTDGTFNANGPAD